MYFKFFKPKIWRKRSAVHRRGLIQSFLSSILHRSAVFTQTLGQTMFRRRYIENDAILTLRNYLPYSLCGFILSHDFKEESLYEVLMNNPLSRIALTRTIISTERSTSEDMRLLGIKKDVPILVFSNTATSADGTVVDYAFTRHRGDLSSFEIEASPE